MASPSALQRSMTSWQRRCISALSRCTDWKSSSLAWLPAVTDDAAPPPRPMSMAGPPSTTSGAPGATAALCTCPGRTLPRPPASITGLWNPRRSPGPSPGTASSTVRKNPSSAGRPNSLLYAAAPSGPSVMISSGDAWWPGRASGSSHGAGASGSRRSETMKPVRPALGLPPRPVAPSSRSSPPLPVAAPACGAIAVGWLWVSTLARIGAGSWCSR
ncbi:MAG: hypothetical protein R2939_13150 [Kofleriaceae bacterium]